jgi:hypothetical protein
LGEPNFLGILVAASHNTIFQVGLAMLEDLINQQWQALARLIRESRRLGQSKLKALIARKMRRRQKPSLADAIGKRRKANALEEYRRRFSPAARNALPAPALLPAIAQGFREPPLPPLERPQVLREPPRPRPPLEAQKPRPPLEAPKPRPQLELLKLQQRLEAPEPQAAAEAPWVAAEASQVTAAPPREAPAETPWGSAKGPRAPVEASWVPIEAPWVQAEAPRTPIEASRGPVEAPWVQAEAPRTPIDASRGPVEAPWVQAEAPRTPIDASRGPVEAPWVQAEAPRTPIDASRGPVEAPWVQAEAPRTPIEASRGPVEAPWVPVEAPWVQAEDPKRQPQPEPLRPQPPFEAPKPQPPLEASKQRTQRTPIEPSRLPDRIQKAERQRRRIKAANQNKRQEPARPRGLSHRFNEALNSLPPSLAHDLSVLRQHKNELIAAVAVCVIAFGGAYFYRSMTPDRKKPIQITHAAPPPRSEPERTQEEKPKAPAAANKKLYYDRLAPSEAAEAASEAPATAAIATASLAEPPREAAPAAPEKTAEPAQAKVEATQPANTAPAASPKAATLAAPEKTAEPAQAKAGTSHPANAPVAPVASTLEGQIADRPTWVRAEKYLPDGTRMDSLRPAAAPAAARLGDGEARKPVLAAAAPLQPPVADQAPKRTESAAAAPTLTQAPAEAAPAPGGYYAQVKSDQSQKAAEAELAVVVEKYKAVLGELPLTTRSADLKDKGTWYRVLIGPVKSHDDADNLCKRLKSAGLQNCIVQKLD